MKRVNNFSTKESAAVLMAKDFYLLLWCQIYTIFHICDCSVISKVIAYIYIYISYTYIYIFIHIDKDHYFIQIIDICIEITKYVNINIIIQIYSIYNYLML